MLLGVASSVLLGIAIASYAMSWIADRFESKC